MWVNSKSNMLCSFVNLGHDCPESPLHKHHIELFYAWSHLDLHDGKPIISFKCLKTIKFLQDKCNFEVFKMSIIIISVFNTKVSNGRGPHGALQKHCHHSSFWWHHHRYTCPRPVLWITKPQNQSAQEPKWQSKMVHVSRTPQVKRLTGD